MIKSINVNLNEPCYFCEELGEYWDFLNNKIISVCRNHNKIEPSS